MNFIASLRNALNCSLQDFGSLFDISSTTIHRAESGSSTLPSKCNIALLMLQIRLEEVNETSKMERPKIPAFESTEIERIRRRNDEIRGLIPYLQRDLLAMDGEFAASEKAIIYLSHILANPDKLNKNHLLRIIYFGLKLR
jgi:transcriptional regulator with XRE-family HTH domain